MLKSFYVPEDAPFTTAQRLWLNEFMASVLAGARGVGNELPAPDDAAAYSKNHVFPAPVLTNYNLNATHGEKQTHHLAFSLASSGLSYEVGDALGVMPRNSETIVDELLAHLTFDINAPVPTPDGGTSSLRDALIFHYDLKTLNKSLIAHWQSRSSSSALSALVNSDDKKTFEEFIWGRELIDLVIDHPAEFADGKEFVSILRKLQPRLYSISSSPKKHPNEVHLTVALVKYRSHGRERGGTCSQYLSQLHVGSEVGVYIHENTSFRLPDSGETPIIMVGPGTGIAPFRAFLEDRQATAATGAHWLFFGNPYQASDYLYELELQGMIQSGVLTRLDTAFSRDQAQKIYVQDRMREQGAELWKWLDNGASFYVCGDAARMAKDVDAALHEVISVHGSKSPEEAVAYVSLMKKQKRYLRDVY